MQAESSEKVFAVNKSEVAVSQNKVECRFSANQQKMDRVLCASQKVEVVSTEMLLGEMVISGKIVVDVVYLTPDGEIDQATSAFSYQVKLENSICEPSLIYKVKAEIIDCKVQDFNEDEIRYELTVQAKVTAYPQYDIQVANVDEGFCAQKTFSNSTKLVKDYQQKLNEVFKFDLKEKVKKVLKVDSQTILKDIQPSDGFVTINGEDIVEVLYVEDDIEPKIKTISKIIPFSEEIEIGGVKKESLLEADISPVVDSVSSTLDKKEEDCEISISRDVNLKVFVFENVEFESIKDVYSLTHSTLTATNSYEYFVPERQVFFQGKIDGSVTLNDDSLRIDKVIKNCSGQQKILSSFIEDDQIVVQGLASTTVIYLNDETNSTQSVEVEIPYEIKQRVGELTNDRNVEVDCVIDNVDVVAKRGKDVFVEAEIRAYAKIYYGKTDAVISEITLQEELPKKSSALEIYFATEGQTLWDVAKDMVEDVELLASQNQDLPEIMTGSEKIVCFRKREIN